jgi:MAP/microtubule affinity-regulating kinase
VEFRYRLFNPGVILFALLCGHLPFDDDNMKELYKKIASGTYKCPDYLLPSARHLISRLITVDPKKRATLQEVLLHPWVKENYDSAPPNFIPERPIITDLAQLSKDITNRLQIFGYKIGEIHAAFAPTEDLSRPNPIRATYHLLSEMVVRERARMINEQRRKMSTLSTGSDQLKTQPFGVKHL